MLGFPAFISPLPPVSSLFHRHTAANRFLLYNPSLSPTTTAAAFLATHSTLVRKASTGAATWSDLDQAALLALRPTGSNPNATAAVDLSGFLFMERGPCSQYVSEGH